MHFLITNDSRDTYNGHEILRKYNKKGDTYKMNRVYTYICMYVYVHTHGVL